MTVDLLTIGIFVLGALTVSLLPSRWRAWALLAVSVIALYGLQPRLSVRFADFILPSLTVGISVAGWWITRADSDEQRASLSQDRITFGVVVALVIGMSLFRFVDADYRLTASRPPNPLWVITGVALATAIVWGIRRMSGRGILLGGLIAVLGAFIALKTPLFATAIAAWARGLTAQDVSLASPLDLNWLGFSYIAFRLVHTLRDRQTGLLPALTLREYLTYVIFTPSLIAGPIDRAERFAPDLRALATLPRMDSQRLLHAGERIMIGLFKKFVIADSLAAGVALNALNAPQSGGGLWAWVLLYGYALRLFFDFSGYTDIAIGVGMLVGVQLPENFNRPYFKTDITTFWQSWHMSLSSWARAYVFSPLSRNLLRLKRRPNAATIALICQIATMITIGLWHGVSWNFLIWGLWHGVGLFVHKVYTDNTRKWHRDLKAKPRQWQAYSVLMWAATFHYVLLGWVWFVLPTPTDAVQFFAKLMGVGG